MNIRAVIHVISALTIVIGVCILTAAPVSRAMNDESEVTLKLFVCGIIPVAFGILGFILSKTENIKLKLGMREGFGIVTFGWIAASIFGCIPFIVIADMYWYDAFFETMSGFTTTGSSVLDSNLVVMTGKTLPSGIADLPNGLLYWRSTTHWLGGMGIVVLSLAIIPFLGIGGQQLYNAEVPGFSSDQLTPRIASSAKILWGVYLLLSVLETILLCFGGMNLFEAWCHTCGTMATGGFSTDQASVGGFHSLYIDIVITVFMFLAGANFVLHFRALLGKPISYFKDEEFRFYLALTATAIILISVALMLSGANIITTAEEEVAPTLGNALRYSSFQVVSILTTTGFATANFDKWPVFAAFLLVCLMFIGGCGGSTGGGMKHSRILLLFKYGLAQIQRCLFPRAISNVRLNETRINSTTVHKVLSFFFLFVALFVFFSLALPLLDTSGDMNIVTSATASVACLGNIGPGLGNVGAACTYSWMSPAAKLFLTAAMLIGRLEIYTVLVVFLPSFWKR